MFFGDPVRLNEEYDLPRSTIRTFHMSKPIASTFRWLMEHLGVS